MSILHSGAHCLLSHVGCEARLLESLVRSVSTIPDPKLRDMIQFALKCSRDPKALTETDYESLRQHGLNTSEIMEIIAMSAFAVYANIIADATAMEADPMFNTL